MKKLPRVSVITLSVCLFSAGYVTGAPAPKSATPKPSQTKPSSPAKSPTPRPSATPTVSTPPAIQYSRVPFDKSVAKVPANFKGHDVVALFAALSAKLAGKGEFETTEAYNSRIAEVLTQPITGQLTPQSSMALVVDLTPGGEYPDLKYDADTQLLQVKEYMGEVPYDLGDYDVRTKQRVISTGRETRKVLDVYEASNGYGAKADVVKTESQTYDLIMLNPKQFGFKRSETDYLGDRQHIEFDLTMDVPTAQKVKPNLDLLIIFQIAPPYVGKAKRYFTPKINSPFDTTIHQHYVYVNVSEIWLYDSKTGEVYQKLTSQEG